MPNVKTGNNVQVTLGDGTPVTTNTLDSVRAKGRVISFAAPDFDLGVLQEQSNGSVGKIITLLFGGSTDIDVATACSLPDDFHEVIKWELSFMEGASGPVGDVVWKLAVKRVPDSTPGVAASVDTDTVTTVTGLGDTYHVLELNKPPVGLLAGDDVSIRIERNASTNVLDTCAQGMCLHVLKIFYR